MRPFPSIGFTGVSPVTCKATSEETVSPYTVYWGCSVEDTLTNVEVEALSDTKLVLDPSGIYNFAPLDQYLYFAWPNAFEDQPVLGLGFTSGGFPLSLAGAAQGYAESENGWSYDVVTIGGLDYRVYRTLNMLNVAFTVVVTV